MNSAVSCSRFVPEARPVVRRLVPGQPHSSSGHRQEVFACRESQRAFSHPVPGRSADVAEGGGMFTPAELPEPHDIRDAPEEAGFTGSQAVGSHPGETGTVGLLNGTPVVFWQELNAVEREAFRSFAYPRSFAAGARLIQEGDRTDHVFVILSGSTEIRIEKYGVERAVAIRGPGQLVGE